MRGYCFLALLLLLSSCADVSTSSLPDMAEGTPIPNTMKEQARQQCEEIFLTGNWQFVHSISFEMGSGQGATVLGVTVLEGEIRKTALMTMEGFVLFEAVLDVEKSLQVSRALPPFDNDEFARRLLADVEDIFPRSGQGKPQLFQSITGDLLCRYAKKNGETLDIAASGKDTVSSHIYGVDTLEVKTITAGDFSPIAGELIPKNIHLTVPGVRGYSLTMTLLSADKIH